LVKASQLIQALDLVHFCGYIDADFVFDVGPGTILLEIPVPRMVFKRVRLMGAMIYGMDVQGVWNETLVDIPPPFDYQWHDETMVDIYNWNGWHGSWDPRAWNENNGWNGWGNSNSWN